MRPDRLDGFILKRVMDVDDAERAGELESWPEIPLDLDRVGLAQLSFLAAFRGVSTEDMAAALVSMRATEVLEELLAC